MDIPALRPLIFHQLTSAGWPALMKLSKDEDRVRHAPPEQWRVKQAFVAPLQQLLCQYKYPCQGLCKFTSYPLPSGGAAFKELNAPGDYAAKGNDITHAERQAAATMFFQQVFAASRPTLVKRAFSCNGFWLMPHAAAPGVSSASVARRPRRRPSGACQAPAVRQTSHEDVRRSDEAAASLIEQEQAARASTAMKRAKANKRRQQLHQQHVEEQRQATVPGQTPEAAPLPEAQSQGKSLCQQLPPIAYPCLNAVIMTVSTLELTCVADDLAWTSWSYCPDDL